MISPTIKPIRIIEKLLAVTLVLVLSGLSVPSVHADNSNASLSINNNIPVASGVSIDGGAGTITLTEGTTKNVVVTATVTDLNDCTQITSVGVKFFRTDLTATGADDANYRYTQSATVDSGSCTGTSDMVSTWTATITVQYYADATDIATAYAYTDWTATVTPSDSTTGTSGNDTIEMSALTGSDVDQANIDYGAMTLNANTGTADKPTIVSNTGNVAINTQVNSLDPDDLSSAMDCTNGIIPVAYEKYDLGTGTAYASRTGLSVSAVTATAIPQRTTDPTNDTINWGIGMPINGISGPCSGTIVFTPADGYVQSTVATVTSAGVYTVSAIGGGAGETIDIHGASTTVALFQAGLVKGNVNQTWALTVATPGTVVPTDYLTVTAQAGGTPIAYTVNNATP